MFEKIIAKVIFKKEHATGFLVSSNVIITAYHFIKPFTLNGESIEVDVEFDNLKSEKICLKASIKDICKEKDVVLLLLSEELDVDEFLPKINYELIGVNASWSTYGYPKTRNISGIAINGTISRSNVISDQFPWDTDLSYSHHELETYKGLSGAPIVINDQIYGVILRKVDGTINGVSFKQLKDFLIKNGINEDNFFEKNDKNIYVQRPVVKGINKCFNSKTSGYVLLKGSPGSGKSTTVKMYEPVEGNIEIIGKYFYKDNDDSLPTSYKTSIDVFARWLESVIYRSIYGHAPEVKQRHVYEWNKYIHELLIKTSQIFKRNGKKALLFIDGIEELKSNKNTKELFDLFPQVLPDNLFIIISCQNESVIPTSIRSYVLEECIFKLQPLGLEDVREIVYSNLQNKISSLEILESIVDKTEGHALYIKYLIDEALNMEDEETLKRWIESTPSINGHIEIYYNQIWEDIESKEEELFILSTISRFREPIRKEELYLITPEKYRISLDAFFNKINHLLISEERVGIYHSSFADFINQRTPFIDGDIHDVISEFCINNRSNSYSIKNILYHLLNRTSEKRITVLDYCNQEWADNCSISHVLPDRVIRDLKDVLEFALSQKVSSVKTIKILLLMQRINFRYNQVLIDSANKFAWLLIFQEEYNDAIKYLIREGTLVLIDEEILHFLIAFLENGAIETAEELFRAIEKRVSTLIDINQLSYYDLEIYFKCLAIIGVYTHNHYLEIFDAKIKWLYQNEKELAAKLSTFFVAMNLVVNESYTKLKVIRERTDLFHGNANKYFSELLNEVNRITTYFDLKVSNQVVEQLVEDLELELKSALLEGTELSRNQVVNSLINHKLDIQIINKLLEEYLEVQFELRDKNGVDFNVTSANQFYEFSIYHGFKNNKITLYSSAKDAGWEKHIENIIAFIGKLRGVAWKTKVESDDISSVYSKEIETMLFNALTFSLESRVTWDRSYFLPEEAFKYIYIQLARLYKDYFPDKIESFLDFFMERMDVQIGLYTEGYRECVFSILEVLDLKNISRIKIFNIAKKIENHIISYVQNRWERISDLLKLAIVYEKINNKQKSAFIFKEILATSMGPSWYKEDQLSLIGGVLKNLSNASEKFSNYLPAFAAILEYSSGEMTFQRYVRNEKEDFIGELCRLGKVEEAIAYFTKVFLPDSNLIRERVEKDKVDYVEPGRGYSYGANNLQIQNAILNILNNVQDLDNSLKWGLSELFIIGDKRYFIQFVKIMLSIIEETYKFDEKQAYIERLKKFYISDLNDNKRKEFRECLQSLNVEDYNLIRDSLNDINLVESDIEPYSNESTDGETDSDSSSESVDDEEGLYFPGTFGTKKSLKDFDLLYKKAREELEMENDQLGREYLVDSLKIVQEGGWNIWSSLVNEEVEVAFNMIANMTSKEEFLNSIRDVILNEKHSPDWKIVDKIIAVIGKNFEGAEAELLLDVLSEHLNLIIKLPEYLKMNFQWLNNDSGNKNTNILIANLLLECINLPVTNIRYRAVEVILWLIKFKSDYFVPIILEHSLKNDCNLASEISAAIIYEANKIQPGIVQAFLSQPNIIEKINSVEHFVIRYIYNVLLNVPSNSTVKYRKDKLNEKLEKNEDFWKSKCSLIDKLEKLDIWGSAHYSYLEQMLVMDWKVQNINEFLDVMMYYDRAYYKVEGYGILKDAIYVAINKIFSNELNSPFSLDLFKLLNRVNLNFPIFHSRNFGEESIFPILDKVEDSPGDLINLLDNKKDIIAYYSEVLFNPEAKNLKSIEVICFLKRLGYNYLKDKNFRFKDTFEQFDLSDLATEQSYEISRNNIRPLISKPNKNNKVYFGGSFIPAKILNESEIVDSKSVYKESWVEGRSWDIASIGTPLREGAKTIISAKNNAKILSNEFCYNWLVIVKDCYYIVDSEYKVIYPF
ncbi:trypsin-like serine protease [Lysinibacillus irui]|uniref:Trypsin-like serine protease n=1 Tax=Lysinibacillus irui TaxID=2998077 RepID=A0ABU5NKL9_9BACI|nr:trypsin-like serine protease [Lysinibacillus irui]MEA0554873.1 trypsin-like serine protease [Lysinibacillus irui]MEA0976588.1 trypsin-like serine protease [Lysinibacillus irui]MEA1042742.1 trypsin-like serine protease [Lysinibacillus irui]